MSEVKSRTYKLCLSDAGLDCFLECHRRVGRAVRDLIPYGVTLFVALAIAHSMSPAELADELQSPECAALLGHVVRFVGFTSHLARLTERLGARLAASDQFAKPPRVNQLYVAALSCLAAADDRAISAAYRGLCEIRKIGRSSADHRFK